MTARVLCVVMLAGGLLPGAAIGAMGTEPVPAAGQTWVLPLGATTSVKMAWIPPGTFLMGSAAAEALHRSDEAPTTSVRLSKGYWLGTTMVTIGEWKALTGSGVRAQLERALRDDTLYDFGGTRQTWRAYMHFAADADPRAYLTGESDEVPMYYVSWQDAVSYCKELNARERAAGRLPPHYEYALPTEAQWEYAARAGTTAASYAGDVQAIDRGVSTLGEIAWYDANSAHQYEGRGWPINGNPAGPHPVASKRPNAWGLYDMAGNLWEWCRDWYGTYPGGRVVDPLGPRSGLTRVNRGGSFGSGAAEVRSAARAGNPPEEASAFRGFRLALVPQ
jgi:sulfatase modifying factor 1